MIDVGEARGLIALIASIDTNTYFSGVPMEAGMPAMDEGLEANPATLTHPLWVRRFTAIVRIKESYVDQQVKSFAMKTGLWAQDPGLEAATGGAVSSVGAALQGLDPAVLALLTNLVKGGTASGAILAALQALTAPAAPAAPVTPPAPSH